MDVLLLLGSWQHRLVVLMVSLLRTVTFVCHHYRVLGRTVPSEAMFRSGFKVPGNIYVSYESRHLQSSAEGVCGVVWLKGDFSYNLLLCKKRERERWAEWKEINSKLNTFNQDNSELSSPLKELSIHSTASYVFCKSQSCWSARGWCKRFVQVVMCGVKLPWINFLAEKLIIVCMEAYLGRWLMPGNAIFLFIISSKRCGVEQKHWMD